MSSEIIADGLKSTQYEFRFKFYTGDVVESISKKLMVQPM